MTHIEPAHKILVHNRLPTKYTDLPEPLLLETHSRDVDKNSYYIPINDTTLELGAQWLSGRVLDSRPKGRGFEPHRRHCVVSLSKNINPSLVLVQPRKTRPFITERLLMGR